MNPLSPDPIEPSKHSEPMVLAPDLMASMQRMPLHGVTPIECQTYSVEEIAIICRVEKTTIYNLIKRGFFRPLEGIRHKLVPREQVHRYLEGKSPCPDRSFQTSRAASAGGSNGFEKKRRARKKRQDG